MSAELSGPPQGKGRHPWDWYVEEHWVTHALASVVPLDRAVTYLDPCCGQLHIPEALAALGLPHVHGTDLFERAPDHRLFLGCHDFLGDQRHLLEASQRLSIIMNPPYSCQDGRRVRGLAEQFIRRALAIATDKVCAVLPLKWLGSAGRYQLFAQFPPAAIWILSERPSMPPGDAIAALGKAAFNNGKVDYMWVVWDAAAPPLLAADGTPPTAPISWIAPRQKTKKLRPKSAHAEIHLPLHAVSESS
ncbi:hypothetical protein GRI97_17590 [Altererythrobacter xixiisoli]|uniref:Methyltransferase n=1 Tax=Croceibacterium xixiisoli TaxID=1476466 RepID=A0A6I4TXB2_9SPHN|nr:hypothetical protein [Croceibacterium xixiisoli]MXP00806.1 hypothetical protein [Croceibacterium xixiisoli]